MKSSGAWVAGWIALAIAGLALLSYFQFPGHTYLQQDSQIYVPILEHLWDPSVLTHDILVERPHVAFTLYDEFAVVLRWITRAGFHGVLAGEQILFRALGLWGVWLIAMAILKDRVASLIATSVFALGAEIAGPAVLIFEYEPTPRAFAIPLVFLAVGLVAHGKYTWAGAAASLGFVLHPPSMYPFWLLCLLLALWPGKPIEIRHHLSGLVPLIGGCALLLLASRLQPGIKESQEFFARVTPEMETLQRMRASYNWVSTWWRREIVQYLFLYAVGAAAVWRLRAKLAFDLKFFLIGLPLVGMLSVPVSYLLLEQMKWALMPQLQPARALLFVTAIAILAASIAASAAARDRRRLEALLWFAIAYLPALHGRIDVLLSPRIAATLAALAAAAVLASWRPAFGIAALAAFFLIPWWTGVRNYPALHTADLRALSDWARTNTPKDAVFLFPDAGKSLDPGIFRSEALRAVYVDWKGGGQVNYLKELGEEWWRRWQEATRKPFTPPAGVDYVVVQPAHANGPSLYANGKYAVYRLPY